MADIDSNFGFRFSRPEDAGKEQIDSLRLVASQSIDHNTHTHTQVFFTIVIFVQDQVDSQNIWVGEDDGTQKVLA